MNSEPMVPPTRSKRRWILAVITIGIFMFIAWQASHYFTNRAITDRIARIRAAGQPYSREELIAHLACQHNCEARKLEITAGCEMPLSVAALLVAGAHR